MKKLMLICSFACMFILGTNNLSAQDYVTSSEALVLLQDQIEELDNAPATTPQSGAATISNFRDPLINVEIGYLRRIAQSISEDRPVDEAIETNTAILNEKYAYKGSLVQDFKSRVEDLLSI